MAQFPSTTSASGIWTLSKQKRAEQGDNWPSLPQPDPYFNYTTLLLPGNGTNGAQNNTFLDSSTNNFTITRNGNTTQGTFSPFSQTGWGNYFDGTGDYITAPNNTAFALGSGNFTIEFWMYTNSTSSDVMSKRTSGGYGPFGIYIGSANTIEGYVSSTGSSWVFTGSRSFTNNQWTHVALVRDGSTVYIYVDGTRSTGGNISTNSLMSDSNPVNIAGTMGNGNFAGYISNFRIVKGTAVYTSNFTPPTSPLTAITNTSLLTCQSNRFVDNSSNAFAITVAGNTSVQAFSPFAPAAAYSAATNGGSGYFDGTGDYLTTATSASGFSFGTGDFTIEFWVNSTQTSRCDPVGINASYSSSGWWGFVFNLSASGDMAWYENTNSRISASSTGWNNGAWNHVAITRSGNSVKMFLNGVQVGSTYTTSFTYGDSNVGIIVGTLQADPSSAYINSYISDLRIVKGTAVYTSAFTPPTAPLAAISNTQLLCNFTNASITDATAKNDLETVGNAQISTAQSKFGGSSIYFDGTGDYLYALSTPPTTLGSGNFTVELWVRPSSIGATQLFFDQRPLSTDGDYFTIRLETSGTVTVITGGGTILTSDTLLSANTWYHIAVVRSSGTMAIYVNGTSEDTVANTTNYLNSRTIIGISAFSGTGGPFTGYMQDIRMTKGIARYTTNFTPPTTAFPLY